MSPRAPITFNAKGRPELVVTWAGERWAVVRQSTTKVVLRRAGKPLSLEHLITVARRDLIHQLEPGGRSQARYGGDEGRRRRAHRTGQKRSKP